MGGRPRRVASLPGRPSNRSMAALVGEAVRGEKSIGRNAADDERLRDVDGKVPEMEGFMARFHPQWL